MLTLTAVFCFIGCSGESTEDPIVQKTTEPEIKLTHNYLRLSGRYFPVKDCEIWGYLGLKDDQWYCRWCIDVECAEQKLQFKDEFDGSIDTLTLAPTLMANTMPITVDHWHQLEGIKVESGPNVEFEYLNPNDQRPIYSLYVISSHEKCTNNVIRLTNRQGTKFDVHWTGTGYSFHRDDDAFELKATAEFTHISFSSEVDREEVINENEIAALFSKVFSKSDFIQHPVKIDRIDEDEDPEKVKILFRTRFTPKIESKTK